MKYKSIGFAGLAIVFAVIFSGCAITPANVDLTYIPETNSPLTTIEPMKAALVVQDNRPIEDADEINRVGDKKNTYGMVMAGVWSNREVPSIVYEALKNELENDGHQVVDPEDVSYDVLISVLLNKYWCDMSVGLVTISLVGTVSAGVSIRDALDGTLTFSREITGTCEGSSMAATESGYEEVLNGALREFVRNFSRNPGVLKALKDSSLN